MTAAELRDVDRLSDRAPRVSPERLVAELVPPPHFAEARFETYVPDPAQPTQAAAVAALSGFAAELSSPPKKGLFRRAAPTGPGGVYLDGGFGVGKTHLLASLWFAAPGPKAFGTFVEFTNLVGALGFARTVDALGQHRLVCIDEFELDDPGDTVLVSSLLSRLSERGVRLAATSNTLPGALGEGRFATQDFLREIQGLSERFASVRIDGEDYRHRGLPLAPQPLSDDEVRAAAGARDGATLDEFAVLLAHLASVHPSRYGALLDGVAAVHLLGVTPVADQNAALRLVVLADRMYDRDIVVRASGVPLDQLFPDELLRGGYRKKYLRALSRLTALAR
ncbi:cell division protein ZapE [Motilibacter peucedani]|uniref:Cell division protein ZapE n=1 Tax=Motilibacter peucedani TaxID=598650 RepID=A0A420XS09_9ACTN|nr:cell division protein ZapE [Motilibacter peucedani]RKS77686.1 cell division protein ZapE [Motilibacter peucedani]